MFREAMQTTLTETLEREVNMTVDAVGMVPVSDDELLLVHGGSVFGWIKGKAIWVKDHIVLAAKSIAVKFKF